MFQPNLDIVVVEGATGDFVYTLPPTGRFYDIVELPFVTLNQDRAL